MSQNPSRLGIHAIVFSCLLHAIQVKATEITPTDRTFFENKIRPVLAKHCYKCHAATTKPKDLGGKLFLDSHDGITKGGESGPALKPGDPDASLIIQALRWEDDMEMPPKEPLPDTVINDFIEWIKRGAPDPRGDKAPVVGDVSLDSESLWSFRPRSKPEVPTTQDQSWARDDIDRFVLARMQDKGLSPTADAPPHALVRRVYYDLIGLPPTMAETEAFVSDFKQHGQPAVERLVDDLLARPQFGERWGRHWLDVARYAESNGDDGLGRNATFPHAWRYRDYVIDAFNRDVPYDRFIKEQIAGDLLKADSAVERNRQLVATGFLAIGRKPASAMNNNFPMDIVADQINAVGTAVMGLSVACARCHDHKHDPIPTRDYYAMAGIFAGTETLYGKAGNEKLTAPPTPLHKLQSEWINTSDKGWDQKQPPKFPDTYAQIVDDMKPVFHERFDKAPESLKATSDVKYSGSDFAKVSKTNIHGQLPESGDSYSVAFWFKNDIGISSRPITAYLFSRAAKGNRELPGDHLGIGGNYDKAKTGNLFVFNGNKRKESFAGTAELAKGTWNHVVLIRSGNRIKLFANGWDKPEIDTELTPTFGESPDFCFANRSDKFAPLEGNIGELAVFDRALTDSEALTLFTASGLKPPARLVTTTGVAMGVRDRAKPADIKVQINGEKGKQGPLVPRGVLSVHDRMRSHMGEAPIVADLKITDKQSGRLQLAKWLTHPDHPQTARVMANRIWWHLFGQAIVATPDDFGVYGARPSHPALLDHLADRLIAGEWSIKQFIRQVVLTRTYQLDSRCDTKTAKADPNNTWLSRHARRRLDAESIRDSLLAASGQLNLEPGVGSVIQKVDKLINWPLGEATNLHQKSNHRSIYLCMLRHAPPIELAAFDLPAADKPMGRRHVTTLPTQGLYLFNSELVVEQALALAKDLMTTDGQSDQVNVGRIYERALQRAPSADEMSRGLKHVQSIRDLFKKDPDAANLKAWASLCQTIFASNEFRYID